MAMEKENLFKKKKKKIQFKSMFSKIKALIKNGKNPKEEESKTPIIFEEKSQQKIPFIFESNYSEPKLSAFKVSNLNTVYYIPSFFSEEAEQNILDSIYSSENKSRWVSLKYSSRRLQKYGGEVTENGLVNQEELPNFLRSIGESLIKNNIFPPSEETNKCLPLNHCLINEYENGIGIMPHTDGPLYYPYVIILSLGSHCCFNFYKDFAQYKLEEPFSRMLIEPRSLLIFTGECYEKYLHCIEDRKNDYVFFKFDQEGKELKDCNIDNIILTDLWKQIGEKEKGDNTFIERNIQRSKRISITIRHVPPLK